MESCGWNSGWQQDGPNSGSQSMTWDLGDEAQAALVAPVALMIQTVTQNLVSGAQGSGSKVLKMVIKHDLGLGGSAQGSGSTLCTVIESCNLEPSWWGSVWLQHNSNNDSQIMTWDPAARSQGSQSHPESDGTKL